MSFIKRFTKYLFICFFMTLLVGCEAAEDTESTEEPQVDDETKDEGVSPDFPDPPSNQACTLPDPMEGVDPIDHLMITEISEFRFSNNLFWIEIYNPTDQDINLDDYGIRFVTISVSDSKFMINSNDPNFTLPLSSLNGAIIRSKQHKVIFDDREDYRASHTPKPYNNAIVGYLPYDKNHTSHITFFSHDFAGAELVTMSNGQPATSVDYVRFKDTPDQYFMPIEDGAWSGDDAEYNRDPNKIISYIRKAPYQDTNTASDWDVADYVTIGGSNFYTYASNDNDNDGIPDSQEDGVDLAGNATECEIFNDQYLYKMGAREGIQDIFLEIDTTTSSNGILTKRTLQKIQETFEVSEKATDINSKMKLHIDPGSRFSETFDPAKFNLTLSNTFRGGGERIAKASSRAVASTSLTIDQDKNLSAVVGIAPLGGKVLAAGLQPLYDGIDSRNNTDEDKITIKENHLYPTIAHELGHNLNLHHGGDEEVNYKPNYVSLMNYLYARQFPINDTYDGAAYYSSPHHHRANKCYNHYYGMIWGTPNMPKNISNDYAVSFSLETNGDINEANIDENDGLLFDGSASQSIDFNCNNALESNVSLILSSDSSGNLNLSPQVLKDFSDYKRVSQSIVMQQIDDNPNISNIVPLREGLHLDGAEPTFEIPEALEPKIPVCPALIIITKVINHRTIHSI